MSWWASGGLTNIASTAFKNAQKKIDNVLDIDNTQREKKRTRQSKQNKEEEGGTDFWNAWLSPSKEPIQTTAASLSEEAKETYSSWSSWGFGGDETAKDKVESSSGNLTTRDGKTDIEAEVSHETSEGMTSMDALKNVSLSDSSILSGEMLDDDDLAMLLETGDEAAAGVDVGDGLRWDSHEAAARERLDDEEAESTTGHRRGHENKHSRDSPFSFGITSMFNKLETGVMSLAKDLTPQKRRAEERDVNEHGVKEHGVKEHSAKERDAKEHDAKERDVKEHDVKDIQSETTRADVDVTDVMNVEMVEDITEYDTRHGAPETSAKQAEQMRTDTVLDLLGEDGAERLEVLADSIVSESLTGNRVETNDVHFAAGAINVLTEQRDPLISHDPDICGDKEFALSSGDGVNVLKLPDVILDETGHTLDGHTGGRDIVHTETDACEGMFVPKCRNDDTSSYECSQVIGENAEDDYHNSDVLLTKQDAILNEENTQICDEFHGPESAASTTDESHILDPSLSADEYIDPSLKWDSSSSATSVTKNNLISASASETTGDSFIASLGSRDENTAELSLARDSALSANSMINVDLSSSTCDSFITSESLPTSQESKAELTTDQSSQSDLLSIDNRMENDDLLSANDSVDSLIKVVPFEAELMRNLSLRSECSLSAAAAESDMLSASDSLMTSESLMKSQESEAELVNIDEVAGVTEQSDSETSKLDSSCGSGDTVTQVDELTGNVGSFGVSGGTNVQTDVRAADPRLDVLSGNEITASESASAYSQKDKISPSSGSSGSSFADNFDIGGSDGRMYGDFAHISGNKSDYLRSEPSDIEIDTTTSSDIEIISTPTPNGDGDKSLDLSPLKISFTHAHKPAYHRRDDSSGSSSYSRPEQPSPERDSPERGGLLKIYDDPYHPDKLLKKLADMSEVVTARESKIIQMSKDNNDLLETNNILRNQLHQVETTRELELLDINCVTEEFTQRLGESDRKVTQVSKDKDSLTKQLDMAKEELSARKESHQSSYQMLMDEKDEEIQELRAEGEKLSKQQLQVNTIIKKLRVKEKENEAALVTQTKKFEDMKTENDHLKKVLDSKEELEKKQTAAINELNIIVAKQEREFVMLKSGVDESQEKCRSLQVTLDSSYKDIAELHKANAAMDSQANEAALSAGMSAREELKMTLYTEQARYRQEQDNLYVQIEDLRLSMARMEKEHGRREDVLKGEIMYLQRRVQEGEDRNQELSQSVTSATRPLLRQIENLQSTYTAQSSTWDSLERNLTERLGDLQTQLAMAVEQERVSSENLITSNAQLVCVTAQVSGLKQEKARSQAMLDMYRAKMEGLEDAKNTERAQIEVIRHTHGQEISELKRDKMTIENQLQLEKTKVESERKKLALLMDQLKEKEAEQIRRTPSPLNLSLQDSFHSDMATPSWTPDLLEHSLIHTPTGARVSVYDSVKQAGAASVIEGLTARVKQQEGEITQLRSDISYLETTRESMARELVNVTLRNDDLLYDSAQLQQLTANIEELEHRNNALLQMYGEKLEEVQELRMDLSDVKELYRSQIDQLTKTAISHDTL